MSSPATARHSRIFVTLLGLHQIVCWGTLTYGVTIFAPAMAARAGCTVSAILLAYAIGLLANGVVAPAATRWMMRVGGLVPGGLGLAVGFAACLVLAQANHLAMIGLGFALAGGAMALTQYDFAWLCVRLYHPYNARKIVTGVTLFGALASSIMWPVGLLIAKHFGLAWGWRGLGLIMMGIGFPCLWVLTRGGVVGGSAAASSPDNAAAARTSIPAAQMQRIVIGLTALSVIGGGVASDLPLVLSKDDISPAVIAGVLSRFGVGQLCARGIDFLGSNRFGLNVTLVVATGAACLSWALL